MNSKSKVFIIKLLFIPLFLFAQKNQKEKMSPLRFEHLRINVADKEATAKWYVENVGLEIIPSKSKEFVYVADKDHNFMLELSSMPNIKNTYFDVHLDGFHLAFEGHKAIKATSEKMLANGGKQDGVLYTNLIGDFVMNVRDPNGFDTQLVHRVNPFYSEPVKSILRFEHFAYNTPDQKITALWMAEFMDLKIPWSKDIDTLKNRYHNYRVPYVGDEGDNMSLELFGKVDIPQSFSKMKHDEVHIAFLCDEPEKLAKRMVYGGAKLITPAITNANGDIIIDLVDPSNFPIRLIKRKTLILKKSKG